ncbi:MAG TPA: Dabb family protein [Gemmataceae bacterium]|nr:Dabb family protein [Gemmataceae bacterium]
MKRISTLAAVFAAAGLLSGHWGSAPDRAVADETKPVAKAPPFVHAVVFTLKKDAPEGAADSMIADAHDMLAKIPTVRELRCGKPAEKKADAKGGYDVGLLVLFDDADGLKTYIDHPQHQKFVAKHLKNVERDKLLVYDFLDVKK